MRRVVLLFAVVGATLLLASRAALADAVLNGGTINKVSVAQGEHLQSTQSTTFEDIPGASTKVSIPSGEKGLILARFSAESVCHGPRSTGACNVRIQAVNNTSGQVVQLGPGLGDVSALDTPDPEGSFDSRFMDRSASLGPGSYTVKAQWAILSPATKFQVDDYSLTVEKAKAPNS